MGGGKAVSSVVFVIFLRQLLRKLAAIPAPLVAGDCGAEAFAAGCPASPTPPKDRRRNRRIRHSRCSFISLLLSSPLVREKMSGHRSSAAMGWSVGGAWAVAVFQ